MASDELDIDEVERLREVLREADEHLRAYDPETAGRIIEDALEAPDE